jgi:hypothetical protein
VSNAARLPEDEKTRMRETIDKLTLRHLAATVCPLPPSKLAALYSGAMDPIMRTTWENVITWWRNTDARPPVKFSPLAAVPVLMPYGERLVMQIRGDTLESEKYPMWGRDEPDMAQPIDVAKVLGDDAHEFHEWVCLAVNVNRRVAQTNHVAYKIIELASTVGQLHRMCPDMVKYTYSQTREALERQQRRSPRPHGWDRIDRRVLRESMDHLALCYLLPEENAGHENTYGFLCTENWIFCRETIASASGEATPSYKQHPLISSYSLESGMFT